ncbi:MAG: cytochrome c oxidase subunit II [Synechococcales cyanobacterium RM1_1_8]|nr:cytochrome c oxidase subunit II [Synechococcales cyanobacterium RM1_1_8]
MDIPVTILTLLAGIAITLISLWFGLNNNLLPLAATDNATDVDALFNVMLTISIGLFLLVQGLIILSAIKFRRQPGDEGDGPPIHGNIPLEILWTAIPAVVVMGISIYSFQIYNQMGGLDPMNHGGHGMAPKAQLAMASESFGGPMLLADGTPNPEYKKYAAGVGATPGSGDADVTVNVLGLQYAWIFNYPEGFVSGELHIPVNKDVQLDMSAQDVLHAFWVPQFRLKQDVIPGKNTQLRFTPTEVGTYPIVCAELCGSYHGAMRTQVIVHGEEDYEAWMQTQLAAIQVEGEAIAMAPQESFSGNPSDSFLDPIVHAMDMDIRAEALAQLQPVNHASHAEMSHAEMSHGSI